ncbi:MAG TPA: hypothetical protein VF066_05095 [Thermoleophilaceae bacterium]
MLFPQPSVALKGVGDIQTWETPTIELWDAWLFAELDAEVALKRWWDSNGGLERAHAFAAYAAALEREEIAARVLEVRLGSYTAA